MVLWKGVEKQYHTKGENMAKVSSEMRRLSICLFIGFCSVFLTGCATASPKSFPATTPTPTGSTTQKSGTTSLKGKIEVSGKLVLLKSNNQGPVTLDSYSVDLKQYNGQTITVTGKYSGDTLYVSSVQL
jgi:hypothetical protein